MADIGANAFAQAGDFAVGEGLFDSICQDFHGLGHRAGDLVAIGHDAIDQTKAALTEEARLIEAGEDWESVAERGGTSAEREAAGRAGSLGGGRPPTR